jgi:hypothetical protein
MYEIGVGMSVGRIAYWHNMRSREIPNNVDPSRIKDNVTIIDNLKGRTIDDYTNETMQEVVDRYNAKQTKKSRRINKTYTEWHKGNEQYNDKGTKKPEDIKLAYECVLSYGNHDNLGGEYYSPDTPESRKKEIYNEAVHYFTKWTKDFQNQFPHLHVLFSVIHADEPNGTIHCHLCFQPRATDYKRGFDTQVSISRALQQDGIEAIKSAELAQEAGGFQIARLYKQFREHMKRDLQEIGYGMQLEEHGKEHIPSNAYTELMNKADAEIQKAREVIQCAEVIRNTIEEETKKIVPHKDLKVTKTQVKENVFSKPQTVYQMEEETYQSINSEQNIKRLSEAAERAAERIERISEQTLDSIESAANKALQQRVEELEKEVYQQRSTIIKQRTTIEQLSSIIENVKTFIRELNLTHLWNRFMEKIREQEQTKERTL